MEATQSSIAREKIQLGDLEGAGRIVEESLRRCGDQGADSEIWSIRLFQGQLLSMRGKNEAAIEYLSSREALYPPDGSDLSSLARIKMHRGYYLGMLGRYAPAYASLSEAEAIAVNARLLELQCEVYQRQAMLIYFQRDFASSDRLFRRSLAVSEEIGSWYFRAASVWGIGKNLMAQEHYIEALTRYDESLSLFASAGFRLWMATVWCDMAVCHLGLGDDRKALALFEDALRINSEAGIVHSYLVVIANIGNVYLHRGDHLRAIDHYRRALELAREIKDPVSIRKWSYNLWLGYARLRRSVDRLSSSTP